MGAVSNRLKLRLVFVNDPEFAGWYKDFGTQLRDLQANHITTTIEFGGGPDRIQPLGKVRQGFKDSAGNPLPITDNAWLPQYDKDFQELTRRIVTDFGWPKGPIVGVKLYKNLGKAAASTAGVPTPCATARCTPPWPKASSRRARMPVSRC